MFGIWQRNSSVASLIARAIHSRPLRNVSLNGGTSVAAKFLSFVFFAVATAVATPILGLPVVGQWMAATSLISLLSVADLGIGASIVNAVARARIDEEWRPAREAIASSAVLLLAIAIALCLLASSLGPILAALSITLSNLTLSLVTATLIALALMVALSIADRAYLGLSLAYVTRASDALACCISIIAVLYFANDDLEPLTLVWIQFAPLIATRLACLAGLGLVKPKLIPQISDITVDGLRATLGIGSTFLLMQIAGAATFQVHFIAIAELYDPASVPEYAILYRVFAVPWMLVSLFSVGLWPLYTSALARKDYRWISRTFCASMIAAIVVAVPALVALLVCAPHIVRELTAGAISDLHPMLAAAVALMFGILTVQTLMPPVLNALKRFKFQAVSMLAMAAVNLPLMIFLLASIGTPGVALASSLACAICVLIPSLLILRQIFSSWRVLPTQ